jgi:HlyD family secretion protein
MLTWAALGLSACGDDGHVPEGSGFIEATEVVISSEVAGRLEAIYFEEGDTIETGNTIALIDTTTLSLRLAQARAHHRAAVAQQVSARLQIEQADLDSALARTDYLRMKSLIEKGSVTQRQFDQAENRYLQSRLAGSLARSALAAAGAAIEQAESEIALLESQLADCRPISPVTGTVVTTYVERGELLGVGKPLIRVAELNQVTVKIYLPPAFLAEVMLGARAEIDPEDGRTAPLTGRVTWISPEAEFTPKNIQTKEARADLVYAVKITIPNPDQVLKVGMPVMARIP